MNTRRHQIVLAVSLAALATIAIAAALWPERQRSADLKAAAGPAETTTTTTGPAVTTTAAPASTTAAPPPPSPPAQPKRIEIPAIGVNAAVVPVGLRPDGLMEVPGPVDAGWYRLGPIPGQGGSAVIAAHIDFGGQRGAFFDLPSLQLGAEVFVDDGATRRRFVVTAREQQPKDTIDLRRFFTADGPARLTLITCGGDFDASARHYRDNIVVTAEAADPA